MPDSIRFLLNDQDRVVEDIPPTMTVLEWLRTREALTGTKEGCAEGDCGACTVAVAEIDPNGAGLRYRAVNACILFVPQLDGKQLITVEHLKTPGGALHPIQAAMVDCHGSQCGFCTPGFVMSLFALQKTTPAADDEAVMQALAGNLCRCTGYRPILDAARQMQAGAPPDAFTAAEAATRARLDALVRHRGLRYETPAGLYYAPRNPTELAGVLAEHPEATILAGGTDVGLWVTKMHKDLPVLVSTLAVAALHEIKDEPDAVTIGAAVSWSDALPALAGLAPSMEELLIRFASRQIRNSGTVGGNVANGSPIGDGMPPMIALGAKVVLQNAEGQRELAMEDLYLGYRKTAMRPGEFVARIVVPRPAQGTLFRTYKVSKRFDQDISAVCPAYLLTIADGVIRSARIAHGGMAATPKRAPATEAALVGKPWNEATLATAIMALEADYQPLSDMRASAAYRMEVAKNLLRRFYLETQGETRTQVYRHAG